MPRDDQDRLPYEVRYTRYWRDEHGNNWLAPIGASAPKQGEPVPNDWKPFVFIDRHDPTTDERTMAKDRDTKREYDRNQPVALDDRDPSNTDPQDLTEPLAPDDDVYSLVRPEQGDRRETSPAAEWTDDDGSAR